MFGMNFGKSPVYLLHGLDDEAKRPALCRPVARSDVRYLKNVVVPSLRVLSDQEYFYGAHSIVETAAHASYVRFDRCILWCIEWGSGLLVVQCLESGAFQFCQLRSPNPNFGGRLSTPEEDAAFDEDAPNPQYNIVFDGWDADLEPSRFPDVREATEEESAVWGKCMRRANEVGRQVEAMSSAERSSWRERCKASRFWKSSS